MDLSLLPTEALIRRRERLATLLSQAEASEADAGPGLLLAAGRPKMRNYPDWTYPFRASSHFFYLVGLHWPGACLLGRASPSGSGGAFTLLVPEAGPDHALWHGCPPSLAAISAAVGCPVEAIPSRSPLVPAGAEAGTLPPPGGEPELGRWLGRDPEVPTPADHQLRRAMVALRLRHDDAGLRSMRRAVAATAEAHRAGMAATAPGKREWEVCAAMQHAVASRGMPFAYEPIVTVHGEVLHNEAHHGVLESGDLVLADVGAESRDGWASDVTRTWPVKGRFSATQRALYEVVLEAQRAAIAAVAPGVRFLDLHRLAGERLTAGLVDLGILEGDVASLAADGVYALFFPHGLGHLLGLDVHDMEDLGDDAGYAEGRVRASAFGLRNLRLDRDLEPGMVVTIEPGLYQVPAILDNDALCALAGDRLRRDRLARFADVRGIRIEDDVLVTESGHEVLSAAIPKQPDEVCALVGVSRVVGKR